MALREPYKPFSGAPFEVQYTWAPDPLIAARSFDQMALQLDDFEEPMLESAAVIRERIEEHFRTESDPEGVKWPELDPDYLRAKIDAGYPADEILVRTGQMKESALSEESFHFTIAPGVANLFFQPDEPDYWLYHQLGTGDSSNWGYLARQRIAFADQKGKTKLLRDAGGMGRGNALPQRAFVGINEETEFEILEVFENWFNASVDEAIDFGLGPAKYGEGGFPIIGETSSGQPLVRIPGVGVRFGRKS